jgi:autotransporter translocation and assembly factor TamB
MKLRLALLSCALAAVAFAAGVDGKWTFETQGRNGPQTSTINLKADGAALTGTISGRGGDTAIEDGKVDGNNISFSVTREMQGNKITIKYSGTVSGDELKLKFERPGQNGPTPVEVTAKRVTST